MKRLFCALITIPVLAGCVAGSFDEQFARAQADAQAMTLRMFGGPIISAAEQGDVKSQYTLGVMYMEGQGAPQDYAEALKWFRLAAMQGHADAQHNLGYMYDNGLGVPQDYTNAAIWFLRAAERGYANSQLRLGALYFLGRVGPADLVQAYKWISLALSGFTADEDRKRAHKVFDTVTPLMTAAQIAEAEALAKAWQRTLTFEDGVTSAEPIEIAGFTVWPPSGGIWTRVRTTSLNSPTGERVVASFAKSVSKSHSFAASVIVKEFDSPLKDLGGSRAWLSSFRDTQEQDLSTGRHRTISFYSTPISLHGAECLRFDAESEDHGRVREAGSVLFMALHMYACVHPQRHAAIMVGFSERLPEGVEPLRLEAEREAFFKSLQFTSSGGLPGS